MIAKWPSEEVKNTLPEVRFVEDNALHEGALESGVGVRVGRGLAHRDFHCASGGGGAGDGAGEQQAVSVSVVRVDRGRGRRARIHVHDVGHATPLRTLLERDDRGAERERGVRRSRRTRSIDAGRVEQFGRHALVQLRLRRQHTQNQPEALYQRTHATLATRSTELYVYCATRCELRTST